MLQAAFRRHAVEIPEGVGGTNLDIGIKTKSPTRQDAVWGIIVYFQKQKGEGMLLLGLADEPFDVVVADVIYLILVVDGQ